MTLRDETIRKLRRYAELLALANEKVRLTGPRDPQTIFDEHIMDAVLALPFLDKSPGGRFADIGTGGGIPGIVWAICRPDMNGVLIDSVGKKIAAVREIADSLGLGNVEAVNARSEELASSRREFFDAAAARAVSRSAVLAEYLSPLVKPGGRLIAFKGPGAAGELTVPGDAWRLLGLGKPSIYPYTAAGKKLCVVIWEKISPCPKRFPRAPGEARRKPWRP
ncbi:MAG: 16S rRNA (guanine(527)-N(7))-methyltransferase RsmG [Synergistaceae bacterium]|jgi:16S rRNA (guanine527-N7)-methyltransferase|nr:16S rRNA (guanine(527)-N(7))-methyltransferase RsmG [Synergistaceae bacterium]